jgi:hypothetical protein
MGPMGSAKVLSRAPQLKKMVMCLSEKMFLLDQLQQA